MADDDVSRRKPETGLARLGGSRALSRTTLGSLGVSVAVGELGHRVSDEAEAEKRRNSATLVSQANMVNVSAAGTRVWDLESNDYRHLLTGHSSFVKALALSPDGRTLFSGSHDHTIRLWDTQSGQCLRVMEGHTNSVDALAFSPDGQTLYCQSVDNVRAWNPQTGEHLQTLPKDSINFTRPMAGVQTTQTDTGAVHFWDDDTTTPRGTLQILDNHLLWSTPPDDTAPHGWFWTTNPDLITVYRETPDGAHREVLADDDPERLAYLHDHNRRDMVMAKIFDPPHYQTLCAELGVRLDGHAHRQALAQRLRLAHQPTTTPTEPPTDDEDTPA